MERILFELAGHFKNKNIVLNRHQFVNGKCEIWCQAENAPFVKRSLARYQAYPVPSIELEEAKKRDKENGIWNNINPGEGSGPSNEISGDNQQTGEGPSQETTDDGRDDVNSDSWGAGVLSKGNGRNDARVSEITPEINYKLKEIIESLDPNDGDHWTAEGLPSIEAVQSAYGPNVTREDINISSEGWNRKTAMEKHEQLITELMGTKEVSTKKSKGGRPKQTREATG